MTPLSKSIHFLITAANSHNDNHARLPACFRANGWQVQVHDHEAVSLRDNQVWFGSAPIEPNTLVWPLGFGPANTFADRQQLLQQIPAHQFVIPPFAWNTLHGKPAWLEFCPPTIVACDPDILRQAMADESGLWVLKPCAGSLGNDVHLIENSDQLLKLITGTAPKYWMLQRYIPAISEGETRTLVCAGKIVGSYLRIPKDGFRANLNQGASPQAVRLNEVSTDIVHRVLKKLVESGVQFAAIDTAGDYLVEVNLANPGGLGTLTELYGTNAAQTAVEAITALVQ